MYRVDESNIDEGFIRSVSMAKFEKGLAGFSACSRLSLSLTLSFCSRLWEIPVSKLWARTHSMLVWEVRAGVAVLDRMAFLCVCGMKVLTRCVYTFV